MYIVDPFQNANAEVNYDLFNSELLIIPMTGVNVPRIGNNIYFSNYESLNGKNVVGINFIDNSILGKLNVNNVSYQALSLTQLRQLTISVYDYSIEKLALDNMPFTSLISPSGANGMKYPYFSLDLNVNFKKSFITVNNTNTFSGVTLYAICLNVYYK